LSVVAASSSRSHGASSATSSSVSAEGGDEVRVFATGWGSGDATFVVVIVGVLDMRGGGAYDRFSARKTTAGGARPAGQIGKDENNWVYGKKGVRHA
jgi:hypothetical protein